MKAHLSGQSIEPFFKKRIKAEKQSEIKYIIWQKSSELWHVRPRIDGKQIHVGYFKELPEAKNALNNVLIKEI